MARLFASAVVVVLVGAGCSSDDARAETGPGPSTPSDAVSTSSGAEGDEAVAAVPPSTTLVSPDLGGAGGVRSGVRGIAIFRVDDEPVRTMTFAVASDFSHVMRQGEETARAVDRVAWTSALALPNTTSLTTVNRLHKLGSVDDSFESWFFWTLRSTALELIESGARPVDGLYEVVAELESYCDIDCQIMGVELSRQTGSVRGWLDAETLLPVMVELVEGGQLSVVDFVYSDTIFDHEMFGLGLVADLGNEADVAADGRLGDDARAAMVEAAQRLGAVDPFAGAPDRRPIDHQSVVHSVDLDENGIGVIVASDIQATNHFVRYQPWREYRITELPFPTEQPTGGSSIRWGPVIEERYEVSSGGWSGIEFVLVTGPMLQTFAWASTEDSTIIVTGDLGPRHLRAVLEQRPLDGSPIVVMVPDVGEASAPPSVPSSVSAVQLLDLGDDVWLLVSWPEPMRVVRVDPSTGETTEELWVQDTNRVAFPYEGHTLLCRDLDDDDQVELVDVFFSFEGKLRDTYREILISDGDILSETTRPIDGTSVPPEVNEICGQVPGPLVRVAAMQWSALLDAAGFTDVEGDHAIDPTWEAAASWDGVAYWPLSIFQGDFRPASGQGTELLECTVGGLHITRELPPDARARLVELAGCSV